MSMALIKSCGNCLAVHRVMAFVINSSSATQPACLLQRLGGRVLLSDVKLIMHPLICVFATQTMRGRRKALVFLCIYFMVYLHVRILTTSIFSLILFMAHTHCGISTGRSCQDLFWQLERTELWWVSIWAGQRLPERQSTKLSLDTCLSFVTCANKYFLIVNDMGWVCAQ